MVTIVNGRPVPAYSTSDSPGTNTLPIYPRLLLAEHLTEL